MNYKVSKSKTDEGGCDGHVHANLSMNILYQ